MCRTNGCRPTFCSADAPQKAADPSRSRERRSGMWKSVVIGAILMILGVVVVFASEAEKNTLVGGTIGVRHQNNN